jgi:hypothetical protein
MPLTQHGDRAQHTLGAAFRQVQNYSRPLYVHHHLQALNLKWFYDLPPVLAGYLPGPQIHMV